MRPEDRKAAIEAGVLAETRATQPDAPKSPHSQKLVADMQAIRLAAVQEALLAKPDPVLDLLAFGLSNASDGVETIFGLRPERPVNFPGIEDGFARNPRLDHGADPTAFLQDGVRVEDLGAAFTAFREAGKKARNAALTETIARTRPYQAGEPGFFAAIAAEAGADIRRHWTRSRPCEVFEVMSGFPICSRSGARPGVADNVGRSA